jgi:hypothetical protein
MKTVVHILWGAHAVSLYRCGIVDANVKMAHAAYDFLTRFEVESFVFGISEARKPDEWAVISNPIDIKRLGMPLRGLLIQAALNGDVETVIHLLDMGMNPDGTDQNGLSALHHAAAHGKGRVVEVLVAGNADINMPTKNASHETALHMVACGHTSGHLQALDALLDAGAHTERPDIHGNRPMHFAARCGNLSCVQKLLKNKADPASENNFRETPMMVAAMRQEMKPSTHQKERAASRPQSGPGLVVGSAAGATASATASATTSANTSPPVAKLNANGRPDLRPVNPLPPSGEPAIKHSRGVSLNASGQPLAPNHKAEIDSKLTRLAMLSAAVRSNEAISALSVLVAIKMALQEAIDATNAAKQASAAKARAGLHPPTHPSPFNGTGT